MGDTVSQDELKKAAHRTFDNPNPPFLRVDDWMSSLYDRLQEKGYSPDITAEALEGGTPFIFKTGDPPSFVSIKLIKPASRETGRDNSYQASFLQILAHRSEDRTSFEISTGGEQHFKTNPDGSVDRTADLREMVSLSPIHWLARSEVVAIAVEWSMDNVPSVANALYPDRVHEKISIPAADRKSGPP